MKICLFSDIHGNKIAFDAAVPQMIGTGADLIIFLGDICGYYFEAIKIWRRLRCIPNLIALAGNHDALFLQFVEQGFVPESYTKKYGPALAMLLRNNPDELEPFLNWLRGLRHSYYDPDGLYACFHGGPGEPATEYIYPDTTLPTIDAPFVFMGHTHCPMVRTDGRTIFCNPGSLGQPRHGSSASFAVMEFDDSNWHWDVRKVDFDREALIASFAVYGALPHYLIDILRR